jgi:hypothetical protein
VVKAEVEILGDAPSPRAQGIYAKPGRHGALIRFSSANNHLGPDAQLGSVLGFAIKIFDVHGPRVHTPRQDISETENSEKGDALAFNQWRVTAEHRPLGEIMPVRRIYSASAKVRRMLNHQP